MTAAFTTYNRTDLLFQSVEPFLNDKRITEIVISDDASDLDIYNQISERYKGDSKVVLFRNGSNMDCYHNKAKAIERATSEWVFILDSDNIFSKSFIDKIFNIPVLSERMIYTPEFARPHFDFRRLSGKGVSKSNVSDLLNSDLETMLNAMNYFVNREEYLRIFDRHANPVTSDSIYQNCRWLEAGNCIYIVPGLQYDHRVHDGSHYRQNVRRTPTGFHDDIVKRLRNMRGEPFEGILPPDDYEL